MFFGYVKTAQITLCRPFPLFSFESADLFQISKSVCVTPEVEVFPFQHVCRKAKPEIFQKCLMLFAGKMEFSIIIQKPVNGRICLA